MSIINSQQKNKIALSPNIDFIKAVEDQKPEIVWNFEEIVNAQWWELVCYCKDCKKNIEKINITKKSKKKNEYKCSICWSNRVVRWTQKSLANYFKW